MRASPAGDNPAASGSVRTALSASEWLATISINAANSGALSWRCANMRTSQRILIYYLSFKRRDTGLAPVVVRFDLVIPGCALLGADPEASTVRGSGFRVRAEEARPGMTAYDDVLPQVPLPGSISA